MIIMMAVPLGVRRDPSGCPLRARYQHLPQIGLILMIGLSAKNAILITEVCPRQPPEGGNGNHRIGNGRRRQRVRPIIMTSFAFILGVVAGDRHGGQCPKP